MDLRKRGIEFSVYFTSAFHLCQRWTDAIGFGAIPSVEFPQITPNYKILHLPKILSQMACKWTKRIVSLITELCSKRSRGNWCILVTALGDEEVKFIYNLLKHVTSDVAVIPLVRGITEYVRSILPKIKRPRVIIATAVAFTGMTFEKCDLVVSCGLTRRLKMNTVTGNPELIDVLASKEDLIQIAGRAGRDTNTGIVISLQEQSFQE